MNSTINQMKSLTKQIEESNEVGDSLELVKGLINKINKNSSFNMNWSNNDSNLSMNGLCIKNNLQRRSISGEIRPIAHEEMK